MPESEAPEQILIVDDNPANLDLLSQVLRGEGYRLRTALSGRMALDSVRFAAPDLILLDISMPEMDGFQVCGQLKRDDRLKGVPIIFISALDDVQDKVKAFQAGGADYVTKPFQAEEVLSRVAYQIQLRRLHRQLEERNRFLAEAYAGLQELDQLKASFAAMLVHDLRSPLTGFLALLDLYEEEGTLEPHLLGRSRQTLQDTLTMLNELMEVYRSDAGGVPLEPRPTTPLELFQRVQAAFGVAADRAGVRLDCHCPADLPPVMLDPARTERILANLVSNALKYTPAGGSIQLEACLAEGAGVDLGLHWLVMTLTDTGRGIPPEQLPYIFDPYRQVSRHDASIGFGLGLAIVQRLMAAHRGRISVQSQVGVGTTFTLLFPME